VEIVLHDPADVTGFARLVRPLLDADPMSHTVTITVLDGLVRRGEPAAVLLSLHEGAGLVGAALRTPGGPLLVSAAHATAVDAALATADPLLPGVAGPGCRGTVCSSRTRRRSPEPVAGHEARLSPSWVGRPQFPDDPVAGIACAGSSCW
jgi:hypothetical protein